MESAPRIRTMDALGLLVLRHSMRGSRGPAVVSKALSV